MLEDIVTARVNLAARLGQTLSGTGAALLIDGRWIDWREIGARADALATALADVPREIAAAQVTRNRLPSVAALLGLLRAERCVLQFSPIQPARTLAEELLKARPGIIIAEREDWSPAVRAAATELGALGLCIEGETIEIVTHAGDSSEHHRADANIAIQMPTSGTTGLPKRIPVTRAQLETYRADRDGDAPDNRAPRVVIIASPLFTVTGLRPFLAWATRPLRLALLERIDVKAWAKLVAEHRPREAGLPPAAMRMLLDSDVPRDALTSLTAWHTGSAPLDPDVAERFEREFGVPVLVAYGATEFGGAVTRMTLEDRKTWGDAKRGSSGRAIPGNQLRIVSQADGSVLAAGESGLLEVWPARTQGGWARTNDIAHLDADGFLYIEGRADDVIIRGGFKVSLREVEAILESHPDVEHAAVLSEEDERLGQVPIAAYVLKAHAQTISAEAIEAWARDRMAPYKRPTRFLALDAMPMTASMKINRPELRRLIARA